MSECSYFKHSVTLHPSHTAHKRILTKSLNQNKRLRATRSIGFRVKPTRKIRMRLFLRCAEGLVSSHLRSCVRPVWSVLSFIKGSPLSTVSVVVATKIRSRPALLGREIQATPQAPALATDPRLGHAFIFSRARESGSAGGRGREEGLRPGHGVGDPALPLPGG